jgi:hypothetical protein
LAGRLVGPQSRSGRKKYFTAGNRTRAVQTVDIPTELSQFLGAEEEGCLEGNERRKMRRNAKIRERIRTKR